MPVLQAVLRPLRGSVLKAGGSIGRVKVADEPTDEVCELCGKPMVIKLGRFGKFMACTGFPECKNTKNIAQGTGVTCPKCGKREIVVKRSRKGGRVFYGCNGYPACDFTLWDRPLPTPCPACGGLMVEAGKRGSGARCTVCGNTDRPPRRQPRRNSSRPISELVRWCVRAFVASYERTSARTCTNALTHGHTDAQRLPPSSPSCDDYPGRETRRERSDRGRWAGRPSAMWC